MIAPMQLARIATTLLVCGGCVARAPGPGAVVQQGLLAQWRGPGGCTALDWVAPRQIRYFPNVRFYEAQCFLEHGDSALAIVAHDEATLFILDNVSSYQLLVDRHPALGVDSSSAIEFAAWALRFAGVIQAPGQILPSVEALPDSVRRPIQAAGWVLPPTQVYRNTPRLIGVWLTAYDGWSVVLYEVDLLGTDGHMIAIADTVWTAEKGVHEAR